MLRNVIERFFNKKFIANSVVKINKGDQYTPFFIHLVPEAYAILTPIGMDFNLLNTELIANQFGQIEMGSMINVIGIKRYSPVRL
jgi:hypothetical protein